MEIKDDLMKNKSRENFTSTTMEKVKVKYFEKACAYNKVILALNAGKEKYLNYETSVTAYLIGNVCVRCHDNSFGVPKNFYHQSAGYAIVTFPEMLVLKENASLKVLVDDEGQLHATIAGNTLPSDKSYHHLSCISNQKKKRRRIRESQNRSIYLKENSES